MHNITDVDDKVYAEAIRQARSSRELSDEATRVVLRGHGRSRPRTARSRAARDRDDPRDRRVHRAARRVGCGLRGGRRRVLQRRGRTRRTADSRARGSRTMVSQESSELKRDQRDFALWKSQKPHEDAAWDSPWGPGRPGWHIECSAMAEKHLGPEFEIHGGGLDLRFPHHENELAQSSALGHRFAHVWMHNGMLELAAEKMSKSLGNVVTLRNVLDTWGRDALLVFHLTGHWSKPVDFSDETMEAAAARAEGFREVFRGPHEPAPAGALGAVRGRSRRRLLDAGGARGHARVARPRPAAPRARHLRARVAGGRGRGAAGRRRARRAANRRHVPRATSKRPIASAPRSRPPAGTCATRPTGSASSGADDARARLRAERRARAVPRAAAGARDVGHGACGQPDPVARLRPAAAGEAGAPAVRGGRYARPPGRRRVVRAVPLRGRLRAREARLAAPRLPRPGHRSAQSRRGRRGAPRASARPASSSRRTAPCA